ncbi:rCG59790 [Rattus norvegicus]|uniref:RCG59790 n=1 Tax=Rattus norvegicus TaxID=10116 RepID=A6HSG9_RAT|nr:rCG59790 [Rattus norvegicus]
MSFIKSLLLPHCMLGFSFFFFFLFSFFRSWGPNLGPCAC